MRAVPWRPTNIGGCSLWLDAADVSTMTLDGGGNVATWADKSGSGRSAVAHTFPGTSLPPYSAAGRFVDFDVDRTMRVLNFPYTPAWTVLVAVNVITIPTGGNYKWLISPFSDKGIVMMGFGGWKVWASLATSDSPGNQIEVTRATNTNGSGSLMCYRNGLEIASSTRSLGESAGPVTLGIGDNSTYDNGAGSRSGRYQVYEIIIYNSALSITDQRRVEFYLGAKWGLRGLLPAAQQSLTGNTTLTRPIPYWATFLPTSVAGCQLWLDAADRDSMLPASGSVITTWRDKTVNQFNATATVTNPVASAPTFNNRTVSFSSAQTQALVVNQGFGNILANSQYTLFAVGRRTSSGLQPFFAGADTLTNRNLFFGFADNTQVLMGYYGGSAVHGTINTYTVPDPIILLTTVRTDTTGNICVNGTILNTVGSFSVLSSYVRPMIGRRYDAPHAVYQDIDVNEIIAYNRALSTSEQQTVESYLANKWGLEGRLPPGHTALTNPLGRATDAGPLPARVQRGFRAGILP